MGIPCWNLKKEVCHVPRQEVHIVDGLSHQARMEIFLQLRLFRLTVSLIFRDDAIIFYFSQMYLFYDISLELLFASVASHPTPTMEDHESYYFPFDVS